MPQLSNAFKPLAGENAVVFVTSDEIKMAKEGERGLVLARALRKKQSRNGAI